MYGLRSLISWCARGAAAADKSAVPSRFLPPDFEAERGLILLAGRGDYPLICARRISQLAIPLTVVCEENSAPADLWHDFEGHLLRVQAGQIGKLLKIIRSSGRGYLLMAGQIAPKKLFHGLKFDLRGLRLLRSLKERNAATIFGLLANEIEKLGVQVLDARSFMDNHLPSKGFGTSAKFDLGYLPRAVTIARTIADLNVGQGIVVHRGTVLAVEGFDGTDRLLRRCESFPVRNKIFIKTTKVGQDFRFDVPVVGLRTLESMVRGGIGGIALEADRTLILDREEFINRAKRLKLAVYGY